eukprot:NODE_123_length_18841_cov_0.279693.p2 type:complete len:776 gc:universal NODE_123_length_18841_cov_0.279693:2041-4368(+)
MNTSNLSSKLLLSIRITLSLINVISLLFFNRVETMNFGSKSFRLDRHIVKPNMRQLIRPCTELGSTRYFTLPLLPFNRIQEDALFTNPTNSNVNDDTSIEEGEITPFSAAAPSPINDMTEMLNVPIDPVLSDMDTDLPDTIPMDLIAQIEYIDNQITLLKSPIPDFKIKQSLIPQLNLQNVQCDHPLLSIFQSSFHILNSNEQKIALAILNKELDKEITSSQATDITQLSIELKAVESAATINILPKSTMSQTLEISNGGFDTPVSDQPDVTTVYDKSLHQFIYSYIHQLHLNHSQVSKLISADYYKSWCKYKLNPIDLPNIEASGPKLQNTTSDVEFQDILSKIQVISQWDDPMHLKAHSAVIPSQYIKLKVDSFKLIPVNSLVPLESIECNSIRDYCRIRRKSALGTRRRTSHDPFVIVDPYHVHKSNIYRLMHKYPNITSKFVQAYQEHHKDFTKISVVLNIPRCDVVALFYYLKYKYPILRRKVIDKPRIQIKWTEHEKNIAFEAFDEHGKDFKKITNIINIGNDTPKSEQHVRTFFYNSKRRIMQEKEKREKEKSSTNEDPQTPVIAPVATVAPANISTKTKSPAAPTNITAANKPHVPYSSSSWTAIEKMQQLQQQQMGHEARPNSHQINKKGKKDIIDLEEQRLSSNIHEIKKRSPDELLRTQFDYANSNLLRRASLQQRFHKERTATSTSAITSIASTASNIASPNISSIGNNLSGLAFSKEGQLPSFHTLERKVTTPPLHTIEPPPNTLEQYIKHKLKDEKDQDDN